MLFERYERHYRIWMWVPLIFIAISVVLLLNHQIMTGSFVDRDVEFTGGKMFSFEVDAADVNAIKNDLPGSRVHVTQGITKTLLVEVSSDLEDAAVMGSVNAHASGVSEPSIREVGPVLGEIFFEQAIVAIIVAFIFMSVIVFILFRSLVPSSIVILSVVTDILATLAIMNLLDISLSLPVLAALLTLIGYSVDTDILLTSRLLKNRGELSEQSRSAMKTGLTMSITTVAALTALFTLTGSFVLEQIAVVLMIGLIVDVLVTWMGNLGILRWWLSRGKS